MKPDRNKTLAKDIIIYGIGNVGSRFIALLLIPLIAYFESSEEIGYYDIALATILFLLPITTLQMRESTFRLLIDNNNETYRKNILSTTVFLESIVFVAILAISFCIPPFFNIRFFCLIVVSVYVFSFYEIYLQAVRILYSTTKFAYMGIITSFLTVAFTLTLFFVFNKGIEALFIGNILSRLISVAIIELPKRTFLKSLSSKYIKKQYISEIFHYSLPLILTAISFGVITICGRYMVENMLGLQDNGDLALSDKFVTIIFVLGTTFYQAWQVTAVKNYNEKDSAGFFSEVFNKYAIFLSLLVVFISFGMRSFSPLIISDNYPKSVGITYIFATGAMFLCFAQFLEITYQCTKQTSKIIYSVLSCAIITPALSYFLIKNFGLTGNVIALCFAYAYLFVFRYIQTRKTLPIRLNKGFFYSISLLVVCGTLFYYTNNCFLDYSIMTISAVALMCYSIYMRKRYLRKETH